MQFYDSDAYIYYLIFSLTSHLIESDMNIFLCVVLNFNDLVCKLYKPVFLWLRMAYNMQTHNKESHPGKHKMCAYKHKCTYAGKGKKNVPQVPGEQNLIGDAENILITFIYLFKKGSPTVYI